MIWFGKIRTIVGVLCPFGDFRQTYGSLSGFMHDNTMINIYPNIVYSNYSVYTRRHEISYWEVVYMSLLEDSLSLSKHGGIYYSKARVEPEKKHVVLFVGLGGSGADALIRIKDQVTNRMKLPVDEMGAPLSDVPEGIGFLAFDTDTNTGKLRYGSAHFDPFGTEFCDLSVKGLPGVIEEVKNLKDAKDECWQWFDDDVTAVGGSNGASGIRQVGRMLLARNIKKIENAIDGKLTNLIQNNKNVTGAQIFVFSGISGGTGAGTFLDMSYILRQIALKKIPNVNLFGYLVMTNVNEMNGGAIDQMRSNGFACLKELNYWMSTGEHAQRYQQKFPGFDLDVEAMPFDFCHLLDASDVDGHQFSYDKILKSVAENVFAYIAGEVSSGNAEGATAMESMYSNIQTYLKNITSKAAYPSCHNFLSVGAAKIEIPYMEISTLIGARVFEILNQTMFQNRPTQESFNAAFHSELEMSETALRGFLYQGCIPRPVLTYDQYPYNSIWSANAPYTAAHQWLAQFQRAVTQQAANAPSYLEGKLKAFFQRNLSNPKTGPLYLRYFIKSDETYSLFKTLNGFKEYCQKLAAQAQGNSQELQEEMQYAYANGSKAGLFQKGDVAKAYLQKVERWYRNEEHWFINQQICDIIDKLLGRLNIYYENIFKLLADILLELPGIFAGNVETIKANELAALAAPKKDTTILIRPFEFERNHKGAFDKAVKGACNNFLDSLTKNMRKWIGRGLDDVDEQISAGVDVPGFISGFISDNFDTLLTINMENVMSTKLGPGQDLEDYVKHCVDDLLGYSYPMFKVNGNKALQTEQFSIISVPEDCDNIYNYTVEYIKQKNLKKLVTVKKSAEKSRFYLVKVQSGFPLYANAFLQDMEKSYSEAQVGTGLHIRPEWRSEYPSPYIQPAWSTTYSCERTVRYNQKYRELFDRCVESGVIREDADCAWLNIADPNVRISKNMLTGSIISKQAQLEDIKKTIWSDKYPPKRLNPCGTYLLKTEGMMANIRENILRFPDILKMIERESTVSDMILNLEQELRNPRYLVYALTCDMIHEDEYTNDVLFVRTSTDPFPVKLIEGNAIDDKYTEYQIYHAFCRVLDEERKEEITLQRENIKDRIKVNEKERDAFNKKVKEYIAQYQQGIELAQTDISYASKEKRPEYVDKKDFYEAVVEELKRLLPKEKKPVLQDTGSTYEEQATQPQPPRYYDPQTGQPIPKPMSGQWVWDSQARQMIQYVEQPVTPPQPPRYYDPQTGQPIPKPMPGQWVWDSQARQMIQYVPNAGMPGQQAMPGMPGQQAMSGMPGQQQMPGMPGQQQMPGMPGQQAMSGMPGQQQMMPGMPGQQQMPGMPGQQQMPGMPGQQVMPGMPGQQVMPGMPGQQQMPGMPGQQAMPSMPGFPPFSKDGDQY